MFEIIFLGTAASVPSPDRAVSSLLVQHGERRWLVDCGEGTQRQIMRSGLGFRRLDEVLLTHGHLDHLLGLAGLASTLNLWGAAERLTVRAGAAPLRLARALLFDVVWPTGRPGLDISFSALRPGPILDDDALRIIAFPVRHAAPDCFGFRFEEPERRPMLPERLAELGVPPGPERSRLAHGETVTLADGRRIEPEQVLGPLRTGTRIAIVGDAESTDDLVEHVRGVDLLVIEATFLEADVGEPTHRSHLTAAQAARLAREAGVGVLWLNHLSDRYPAGAVEAEARAIFENAHAAEDFARVRVPG